MSAVTIPPFVAEVCAKLRSEGWEVEAMIPAAESPDSIYVSFKSNRLDSFRVIRILLKADSFEETMRNEEAAAVAYQNHDATISITFAEVKAKFLRDLANLYRLQAQGKVIEIPTEIKITELTVPFGPLGGNIFGKEGDQT